MKLWQFELKKLLITQKGLLVLTVCLCLKLLLLCFLPELKDQRIALSQKQYDYYLEILYGENTEEKSAFIQSEHQTYKDILEGKDPREAALQDGTLVGDEWSRYVDEKNLADLRINGAAIFAEKAERFAAQDPALPPARYIYEYGWQTIYTLGKFPDIFLLLPVLLMTAQCFSAEAAGGMLPVLLAAKKGRKQLFRAKLLALLAVTLGAALVFGGVEAAAFSLRGWCNDPGAPLYSITLFSECSLNLSLGQGYALTLGTRLWGTLLFGGMFYGISVWLKNTTNLLFMALCVLLVPVLFPDFAGTAALYTHGGLLCGSRMLLLLGESGFSVLLPLFVVAAYSALILGLAERRHRRGL